ncbi:magnesium chelatase subunit D [Variovorax sp. GT1P44]|uniref:magnesium chelatase subunit D n=1 Tax=Variovorax sp. GT1P44 TaxID=3443742 RepID=UPI003F468B97
MTEVRLEVRIGPDFEEVAALFCVDPAGMGGIVLRAGAGPMRDAWLQRVRDLLPDGCAMRFIPINVEEDRLLGGLDLAATLTAGRPVGQSGVLAESDGGVVLLGMAERAAARNVAHIAAALDVREVVMERHGLATRRPARFGVIALDEGLGDDEAPSAKLLDRLAIHLGLSSSKVSRPDGEAHRWTRADVVAARSLLPCIELEDEWREAVCAAAVALGIPSLRAPLLALRVAGARAALHGRTTVDAQDAAVAARWVLAPRATAAPAEPTEADANTSDEDQDAGTASEHAPGQPDCGERAVDSASLAQEYSEPPANALQDSGDDDPSNVVLEAALAALPAGMLDALKCGPQRSTRSPAVGRAGVRVEGVSRGRPDGVRRGEFGNGARLNLIETLRAASPWQSLRRAPGEPSAEDCATVRIRREDFRFTRYSQRSETSTFFTVDASGSAALHRLAEAKGAVELLLADCYARRDSVSLIAFGGRGAEVLLPPTRSLARARRSLAGLAGGGGTPLAAAIDATLALADAARRRGRTPVAVLLTDGHANIARDGSAGRLRATSDALQSARRMHAAGIATLVLDTSPHPQAAARELAAELGATYLPLPHADAVSMSRAVRAAA